MYNSVSVASILDRYDGHLKNLSLAWMIADEDKPEYMQVFSACVKEELLNKFTALELRRAAEGLLSVDCSVTKADYISLVDVELSVCNHTIDNTSVLHTPVSGAELEHMLVDAIEQFMIAVGVGRSEVVFETLSAGTRMMVVNTPVGHYVLGAVTAECYDDKQVVKADCNGGCASRICRDKKTYGITVASLNDVFSEQKIAIKITI